MKKLISIFLLCSFILLLFASCMSEEEKQQARENEETAKPIIEKYIDENYKGALVEDIECLIRTSDTLFGSTDVTDSVKAKILYDKRTFNVVVDLETGKIYTDYYKQKIADEIESLVVEEISVQNPKDIEIRLIQNGFVYFVDDGGDYFEEGIDSAEELLKTGSHQIFVLCKYANSQMDFKSIPVKSFFKNEYKSDIHIAFVNYRDAARYVYSEILDSNSVKTSMLFNQEQDYYNISEIKSASQINEKKKQSNGKTTTELVYEEDYKHYKLQTFNNIEFIWNDECYDIDFSEATAEEVVVTDHYNGEPFYATSKNAVKLDCLKITDKEFEYNNKVYMYFPRDLQGEYVVTKSLEGTVASKLHWIRDEYFYEYQILKDYYHEFTIGFYKRADSEQKQ